MIIYYGDLAFYSRIKNNNFGISEMHGLGCPCNCDRAQISHYDIKPGSEESHRWTFSSRKVNV